MTHSIVWGPEIRVDGKRPSWLEGSVKVDWRHADDEFTGRGRAFADRLCFEGTRFARPVAAIRLPADHPHYRQPTAPELDPALWDRMVALVIMMARIPCSRKYPKGVFGHEARYAFDEARDIAARLAIDPDLAEAREMLALSFVPQTEEAEQLVLHAIKRGRELATPEVSHVG